MIALTTAYYYLSIPLLILIVIAAVAGIFYLFFVAGRIPIRLALFVGAAGLLTLYSVLRSVLTRIKESAPGRPLAREDAPALWTLTEEVASQVNTRWIFLNVFHRIFLLTTLGASRLQEILADRYAAMHYGARNFADALRHIVHRMLLFEMQVSHEIDDALHSKRSVHNLYTLPDLDEKARGDLDTAFRKLLQRPTEAYDSHPSIGDRFQLLEQLQAPSPAGSSPDPVRDLLPTADRSQAEMTDLVQDNVQQQQRHLAYAQR